MHSKDGIATSAPPVAGARHRNSASLEESNDSSALQTRLAVDGKFFTHRGRRHRLRGVTYGPFCGGDDGHPFPAPSVVRDDLAKMADAGINAVRTYHLPPAWFFELVEDMPEMGLLIDVPWSKHLCFLQSNEAQAAARASLREAVNLGRRYSCVQAYSIGNEIPADIVRWHGARRIERFLAELMDTVKQADDRALVTYANFPPTEYLDLSFLDFATFNVYLHDRETFRRYLLRLQNLVSDRPLVLGELGMDSLGHGELAQADMLAGHLAEAKLVGLAGTFVFSWTDEWYTGGTAIEDWAFGLTRTDRSPKAAYHAVREVNEIRAAQLLPTVPRVSVVVCSYNGGSTLRQCLQSLAAIDYPDYEVILVDDGSTDDTPVVAADFPHVRTIRQENAGLSAARNVGLWAATGSIVAYTDDDCFVDREWITHLVAQLEATGADGVGGPNFAPEDGSLAACIAACPGQPAHVLESDQVAEHVPGCNMAFRVDALKSINGFDVQYRQAGDDVDVCWRLQHIGLWITFAPSAFVWHHRRQTIGRYLKQQAGYGRAEALLRFKHPDRYNNRGQGIWRGMIYGDSHPGIPWDGSMIYRGTFGTGLFQCIYRQGAPHWAMIPSTLEWQTVAGVALLAGLAWWPSLLVAAVMLVLSLVVAGLQAARGKIAPRHDGIRSRLIMAGLCNAQPLVRSWSRYYTRYFAHPDSKLYELGKWSGQLRWLRTHSAAYWGANTPERTEMLRLVLDHLETRRCGVTVDNGWLDADLEIFSGPFSFVQVRTAQETHAAGQRVIRVRYVLKLGAFTWFLAAVGLAMTPLALRAGPPLAATCGFGLLAGLAAVWHHGAQLAARIATVFDGVAAQMGLVACDTPQRQPTSTQPAVTGPESETVAPALCASVANDTSDA